MHLGHSHEEMDHESLALRHFGEGVFRERVGQLSEALQEYQLAYELNPDLQIARQKVLTLRQKLDTQNMS